MKIRIHRLPLYIAATCLLPLGIVLSVKADCGISVATSATYVLSLIFNGISFGTFNYLYQGAVFVLMLILIREIRLKYFLSFLTSVVFGYGIDLWGYLLGSFSPAGLPFRVLIFAVSLAVMSVSISLFILSGMPLLPFDIFVRKVSAKFGLTFGRLKLVFDLSNLVIAVSLSFLAFGRLLGVSWGTFIYGFSLGPLIGIVIKFVSKRCEVTGRIPAAAVID